MSWAAGILFFSCRFMDIADQTDCGYFNKRVEEQSSRIRNDKHIAFIYCFPTSYRRAVEAKAIFKRICAKCSYGNSKMLPLTGHINKFKHVICGGTFFSHNYIL